LTLRLPDVARGIGPLAGVQVFAAVCGLAATAVWARLLPVETYGEFRTALAVMSFISMFCLLGTSQAATMAAAQNQDGSLMLLLRNKLLASGLGAVGLAAAAAYYASPHGNSPGVAAGLIVAAIAFPAFNISDIWLAWIQGKARFGELAAGRVVSALINLGAVVAGGLMGVTRLWPILAMYLVAQAILNGVMLFRAAAKRNNRDIDASIIRFGNHATLALTFNSLLALDMVILNHFASAKEVAVYAIALQFPDQLKTVFAVLGQAVSPYLYRTQSATQSWKALRGAFFLVCLGMFVIGAVGFFALPPLTHWLFTARYADAAEYGKWLWLALAWTGPPMFLQMAALATKRPFFMYAPNVGYPILLVSLYILFADKGAEGIVTARIIGYIAMASLYVGSFAYCRVRRW